VCWPAAIYDNYFQFLAWVSLILAPLCVVYFVDFFLLRRRTVHVRDIYAPEGVSRYSFWQGVDPVAFLAVACGGDAPTAPHVLLRNVYIAATRRSALDPSLPPNVPRFALPLADALRHAYDAAWSCGTEKERGRLSPGLLADFTVIDRSPFTAGIDSLLEAVVLRTVTGGLTTYFVS
jgi:hypothetical protein